MNLASSNERGLSAANRNHSPFNFGLKKALTCQVPGEKVTNSASPKLDDFRMKA
jgi:hypothetical protein